MATSIKLINKWPQSVNDEIYYTSADQAPAVYRKIPVYRDWTQIPIPGFLKIKYRYFSGFLYSMCVLKLPAREDAKSHWLHLFGFFLHCAFSCVSSNGLPERMQSHIGYICLTFLNCAFSNVSSNRPPHRMHSHIGCICLTFLHCDFSNVSSNGMLERV